MIAEPVDELGGDGLLREEWPAVDERLRRIRAEPAAIRDRLGELVVKRAEDALQRLLERRAIGGIGQLVDSTLVLLAFVDARNDAELVEGTPEKRGFGDDADEVQLARGLQPDLLACGRDRIAAAAAPGLSIALGEGDRELAALAEGGDRIAQLLVRRVAERFAEADDEALDAIVAARALERLLDLAQRHALGREELDDAAPGSGLGGCLGEIELECGGLGYRAR